MEQKTQYETPPWTETEESTTRFPLSEPSPTVEYVIKRWGEIGDKNHEALLIEGRVSAMSFEWQMNQGDFKEYRPRGYVQLVFNERPFKCDIVIDKPSAIIADAGDDTGVIREVMRKLGHELGLGVYDVAMEHMRKVNGEALKSSGPIVDAKKTKEEVL